MIDREQFDSAKGPFVLGYNFRIDLSLVQIPVSHQDVVDFIKQISDVDLSPNDVIDRTSLRMDDSVYTIPPNAFKRLQDINDAKYISLNEFIIFKLNPDVGRNGRKQRSFTDILIGVSRSKEPKKTTWFAIAAWKQGEN